MPSTEQVQNNKLPKNVIWVSFASFFNDVSGEIIIRALPLFLAGTLGIAFPIIGLIEGLADSTSSLLKIFSGWYSDKIRNRKRMTGIGYVMTALARPILIGTTSWVLPLLSRFLDRAGKGIRTSPRDALVADSVDHTNRGRAFGFIRSLDPAGAVVGSLIAAAAIYFLGGESFNGKTISSDTFNTLVYIAILPTFISVILIIFLVKEPPRHEAKDGEKRGTIKEVLTHKRFRSYLIILFIFTLGSSSDAFLILRANSLGIAPVMIFVIYAVLNFISAISSYPAGILSDRLSRRKMILTGWILYALIYAGFAFASEGWHIWGLFLAYGAFFGLTEGAERALVADLVPREYRGTAYGLYNGILGIGLLPASLIAGFLWENYGAEAPFLFGGGMALIAAIAISRMHFRKQ
jgi:MFS family permease